MHRYHRVVLIAIATLFVSGCASKNQHNGYARRPELKSSKSARGSSGRQSVPDVPRILPETNLAAGRIFEQQGAIDKAIEQYRKAIAVNHDYTDAYARLGLMLSITGKHEESVAAFTELLNSSPAVVLRNNLA
jgi:tetratricopeptide (TPR) repeat protein